MISLIEGLRRLRSLWIRDIVHGRMLLLELARCNAYHHRGTCWKRKADAVGLQWDASSSEGIANYRIRYGNFPGVYHSQKQVTPRDLETLITNLSYGTWYFAAFAVLTNGLEGEPSNELAWTNRVFVPLNLRLMPPLDALILQTSVDGIVWKTIAVITPTNPQPVLLTAEKNKLFRTISTNFPPPLPASR